MLIPHTEKSNLAPLLLIATLQLAEANQFIRNRRSMPDASDPLPAASITVSASGVSASNNEISPSDVNAFASEISTTTASSSASSLSNSQTSPLGVNAFASEISFATASVTAATGPSNSGFHSNPNDLEDHCLDYTDGATIVPLASTLRDRAQALSTSNSQTDPSSNCSAPNGGCASFVKSLDSCQDDNCACELSYPAQLCAQCLSSEDAVHEYNLYLIACAQRGLIKPTETVTAECEDATETSDVLTDMLASQLATKTASATSTSDSTKNANSMGNAAVQMPDGSQITDPAIISDSAEYISTMTTTNANGQATSVLTFVGPTAGAVSSGSSIPASGSTTDQTTSTAALDSTHTFFSETVDPTCEKDCESWRDLAQTCTSDNCICTSDAIDSAKACSSCVLSASGNQQMAAYAGFTQGCISASSVPVDANGETITTDPQGNAAFAIPPSSTSKSDNFNPFEQDTQEVQSKGGAAKTRVAEQAKGMATTVEVEPSDGAAQGRAGQLLGIGGMSWVVTGVMGGLLIVHI